MAVKVKLCQNNPVPIDKAMVWAVFGENPISMKVITHIMMVQHEIKTKLALRNRRLLSGRTIGLLGESTGQ